MSIVSLANVEKSFGSHAVLKNATVTVGEGDRVGVVGINGAGKSTLAKVIAGVDSPDAGSVQRRRGARVAYLEQVPQIDPTLSAEQAVTEALSAWSEAIARHHAATQVLESGHGDAHKAVDDQREAAEDIERLGGWNQQHHVREYLNYLGISRFDATIGSMSGGELRRVAIARILIARPDLAVLDEPTNHLDADTIEWLENYLINEFPGAVVLITHDRYLLDRVATHTWEVADGKVFEYEDGYELYLEKKAERNALAQRAEQNRQNFLRTELEWLRRQPKARTTKAQARIDRAEAAIAIAKPKVEKTLSFSVEVARTGKTILESHKLLASIGGRVLFSDFDFLLSQGERVGIVGPNGAGKTTLLRLLLRQLEPTGGRVVVGQNTRIAYFDQHRSELVEDASIFENVVGDQPKIIFGGQPIEPRSYLERFGFDSHKQRQPVASLSGGERARVGLARLLRSSANLFVFDEPTNDLDVATLGSLEQMLIELEFTALIVTHDRWFLNRVATAILTFEGGRITRYPGNYETYQRLLAEKKAEEAAEMARAESSTPKPEKESMRPAPRKKGLTFNEDRELQTLPDAIEKLESETAALNEILQDPRTYATRGAEIAQITADLDEKRSQADRLTARWEELETKKASTQ